MLWTRQIIASSIVIGILIFIVLNFYIFSSIVNLNTFFYAFLLLSLLTDGAFVLLHLPRRRRAGGQRGSFSPEKLTVVIACHNGEDVIQETIMSAARKVPLDQIVVVSDASADNTVKIAKSTGVRVIDNKKHLHKVGSINSAISQVHTPYVLILDDDTLIGDSFIPTSLLDEGYTAVAFNVMPLKDGTLINELQQFEYRSTMQMSKHLRSNTGAIGNVSGAIGLYRAADLRKQITLHSGQFAGEDEQRTLLAHMYGSGKGVTYTDSLVITKAPDTYKSLFKQRAFSWNIAAPELFVLYWRVLLSPKFHYLLKAEKAYYVYIYITEPLRILFLWTLFLRPQHAAIAYGFYLMLNTLVWLRMGAKDTLRAVVLAPIYALALTITRFIGYFYWLKVKTEYLYSRMHKPVVERYLLAEYCLTFLVIIASWGISVQHYVSEMHLFNQLRTETLSDNPAAFNYDSVSARAALLVGAPSEPGRVSVVIEPGDSTRALAHKAINKYTVENPGVVIKPSQRWTADMTLAGVIPQSTLYQPNTVIQVPIDYIKQSIAKAGEGREW